MKITEETTCRCGHYGGSAGTEKNLHTHCTVCGNTTDANGGCRRGVADAQCPDARSISVPLPTGGNRSFAKGDRIRVIRGGLKNCLARYQTTVTDTDSYGVYFLLPNGLRGFAQNSDVEMVPPTFNERAETALDHCSSCGPNGIRKCGACICHDPQRGWNPAAPGAYIARKVSRAPHYTAITDLIPDGRFFLTQKPANVRIRAIACRVYLPWTSSPRFFNPEGAR